jgi:hypothetical protein
MTAKQSTQALKAEIAMLYAQRGALMSDLLTRHAHARGLTDLGELDEKTREHLTFEIVQLIARWDGARGAGREAAADDDVGPILAAIVELEDSISALEGDLPEN